MAIDVYVMPLWRFKAGVFEPRLEEAAVKLGLPKPKIVTPFGISSETDSVSESEAKREVEAIRTEVEAANHVPILWNDDGPVVYSAQCFGIEPLQAYAKWLDYRDLLPAFDVPPEGDYRKHPAMSVHDSRSLSFPHLYLHNCYSGYFLPCEFANLVSVERTKFRIWTFWKLVGSSIRLREELMKVDRHLQVGKGEDFADDPLLWVKCAFRQMREVAELSCRQGLPVIFSG